MDLVGQGGGGGLPGGLHGGGTLRGEDSAYGRKQVQFGSGWILDGIISVFRLIEELGDPPTVHLFFVR